MRYLLLAVLLFTSGSALADQTMKQLRDHARHHDFYKTWDAPSGGSCCNNLDCEPVQYRTGKDTKYEMFTEDRWWPVPDRVILKKETPDGNAHACIPHSPIGTPSDRIKCFVPGMLM